MTRDAALDLICENFQDVLNIVKKIEEPYWHTEEPTEEGWYSTVYKISDSNKYVYETSLFRNGKWYESEDQSGYYPDKPPVAWHKIPPL